jgi:hypothetical protein
MSGYDKGYETIFVMLVEPGRLDDIETTILGQVGGGAVQEYFEGDCTA